MKSRNSTLEGPPNRVHTLRPAHVALCQSKYGIEEFLPFEKIIFLDGELQDQKFDVLDDDGCNKIVVSKAFLNHHRDLFDLRECEISVTHYEKEYLEQSTRLSLDGKLRIGSH